MIGVVILWLHLHFYPRSPCGERPLCWRARGRRTYHFYPRSPCGERRHGLRCYPPRSRISIHALLAESDKLRVVRGGNAKCISIHALLAESDLNNIGGQQSTQEFLSTLSLRRATHFIRAVVSYNIFLSTLSLRRATKIRPVAPDISSISIHALLAESDPQAIYPSSTPPISIHALLAESDKRLCGRSLFN